MGLLQNYLGPEPGHKDGSDLRCCYPSRSAAGGLFRWRHAVECQPGLGWTRTERTAPL